MRRRPLMNDIIMTINLIIIFMGCFLIFYIIGGAVENKLYEILPNVVEKTSSTYYYLYFSINSIVNYAVIVLSIIFSVRYTFKFFVCYQDDGEKVFKNSMIGLGLLLLYNNYSLYNNMIDSFKDFDSEKLFVGTQALTDLWSNLQDELKLVFIIVNLVISVVVITVSYKKKKKMIEKCDFRI